MYCTKCGKSNPEDSKFCKYCGTAVRPSSNSTSTVPTQELTKVKNDTTVGNNRVGISIGGWVAILGVGLIISLLMHVYAVLGYLPLISQEYNIVGYTNILVFEMLANSVISILLAYLLFLYFKRNKNFPNYYIILLCGMISYAIVDHIFLASLEVPTTELQTIIDETLSTNATDIGRNIAYSIIWILYMKKSKRVKETFVYNN